MKKRWLAVLAALALTAGLMAGCGSNGANADGGNDVAEGSNPGETDLLDKIQEAGVIVVGTEGTYSPNSYHDENGDLVGFDVDVARGVADHLGVDIQFVEAEWDSLFASMDSGRVDIVVNEVEYSDERAVKYDFSEPYTYVHGALLVAEDSVSAGSVGERLACALEQAGISARVALCSSGDTFTPHGSVGELKRLLELDGAGLAQRAMEVLRFDKTAAGC